MVTMNASTPDRSNLYSPVVSALLSGAPRISHRPSTLTAMATQKIERQPKFCDIRPPTSEHRPEPPQEPIDHMLMARWRSAPSQKAFTSARLAGMMQAADRPCSARPTSRTGVAS